MDTLKYCAKPSGSKVHWDEFFNLSLWPMKKTNFVSLSMAFTFLSIGVTGVLMYFGKKMHPVETIHVIFGLLFIGFAIFHILHNWPSLKSYSRQSPSKGWKKEFLIVLLVLGFALLGAGFELKPFRKLKNFGEDLFPRERRPPGPFRISFASDTTNQHVDGLSLSFVIEKDKRHHESELVIWVEDSSHHVINNLFVTDKIKPSDFPTWKSRSASTAVNFKGKDAQDNFFLTTKTTAPFGSMLVIEIRDSTAAELYTARIERKPALQLTCDHCTGNHEMLKRALVQVQLP